MNHNLSFDELNELLPAYAMGILEPDEMLAVSDAIEQNPELQARLESLDEVTATLGHGHEAAVAPPSAVRTALMTRVKAEISTEVSVSKVRERAAVPMREEAISPAQSWLERLFGGNPWKLATGLAAVLLVITVGLLLQRQQILTETENELAELQTENGRLQEQLDQEQAILASLTNATQTIALAATDEAPRASGEFYRTSNEIILVARGLSAAPEAKAYYLWGVILGPNDEKIFTNLGPVPLDEEGNIIATYSIPPGDSQYDVIDVSLEDQSDPPPPALEGDIVLRGLVDNGEGGS